MGMIFSKKAVDKKKKKQHALDNKDTRIFGTQDCINEEKKNNEQNKTKWS